MALGAFFFSSALPEYCQIRPPPLGAFDVARRQSRRTIWQPSGNGALVVQVPRPASLRLTIALQPSSPESRAVRWSRSDGQGVGPLSSNNPRSIPLLQAVGGRSGKNRSDKPLCASDVTPQELDRFRCVACKGRGFEGLMFLVLASRLLAVLRAPSFSTSAATMAWYSSRWPVVAPDFAVMDQVARDLRTARELDIWTTIHIGSQRLATESRQYLFDKTGFKPS